MTSHGVIPAPAFAGASSSPRRRGAGIQAPSLRKQGTIKNWVPVFTGNPGFLVKPGMTKAGECLYNYGLIIVNAINKLAFPKCHCERSEAISWDCHVVFLLAMTTFLRRSI